MKQFTVQLPYGNRKLRMALPKSNVLGCYYPKVNEEALDEDQIVGEALKHPVGSPGLSDLARQDQQIRIVISDVTRPCPSHRLLPFILKALSHASVRYEDIQIIVALGDHRSMSEAELTSLVGPKIRSEISVVNHESGDILYLGKTSRGTPVELFRPLIKADLRICIGNLEPHYFAGFSGGSKAILPGCASKATITANHSLMFDPKAKAGLIEDNPVRMDLEEGAALVGVDFILNVILDANGHVEKAVAGDAIAAHRKGCDWIREKYMVPIPRRADIVLASAGGFPKDINLYQAHKALENASYFVREGGVIVLVAECREGFGNPLFEEWMLEGAAPKDLIARIQKKFILGAHKSAALASILERTKVLIISEIEPNKVERCGMTPFRDLGEAIEKSLHEAGRDADVIVLPQAGSIQPVFIE